MNNKVDRKKVVEGLKHCSKTSETCCYECPYNTGNLDCIVTLTSDTLALVIKYETMFNKACETLGGYRSEEPCGTLFYIAEERRICDKTCNTDGADTECWKRYLNFLTEEERK